MQHFLTLVSLTGPPSWDDVRPYQRWGTFQVPQLLTRLDGKKQNIPSLDGGDFRPTPPSKLPAGEVSPFRFGGIFRFQPFVFGDVLKMKDTTISATRFWGRSSF